MQQIAGATETLACPAIAPRKAASATDALRQKIADAEAPRAALDAKMDALIPAFGEQLSKPAAAWINERVERQLRANLARTKDMKVDDFGPLVSGLAEIVDGLPEAFAHAVAEVDAKPYGEARRWPHHANADIDDARFFTRVFRQCVATPLGRVLARCRLESGEGSQWRASADGGAEFVGQLDIDLPAIAQYVEARAKYAALGEEIERLNAELTTLEVLERFASAKGEWPWMSC